MAKSQRTFQHLIPKHFRRKKHKKRNFQEWSGMYCFVTKQYSPYPTIQMENIIRVHRHVVQTKKDLTKLTVGMFGSKIMK